MDSIIFDLDGTLWDSAEGVAESWNSVLSEYNYNKKKITVEELRGCMGKLIEEIAEMLFPELDLDNRIRLVNKCCEREQKYLEVHGGNLYTDLEDTLKILYKKYKLFIVSNCQDGYIECFFKAHKLKKYFKDYECPGRTGVNKGENIKLIIDRNSLKNPIYIGDTQGDADAAAYANIPFVYAEYGFGNVEKFKYNIKSIKELVELDI